MTLLELFEYLSHDALLLVIYFVALPLTAFVAGLLDRNKGHVPPWNYLYTLVTFLACIPGLCSLLFNGHLLILSDLSPMDVNIYFQILPIASMLASLWLIRLRTAFDNLIGFDSIWELIFVLFTLQIILWIVDQSGLLVLRNSPVIQVIPIFFLLLSFMLWGRRKLRQYFQ